MCKSFAEEVFKPNETVSKHDQLVFMDKSIEYFASQESFQKDSFQKEVLQEPEIIEAFEDYQKGFQEKNDLHTVDEFPVHKQAFKQGKKGVRPVIKLDKRFHVYVHGGQDYIERGFDNVKGMNYYKLYFNAES
jgi:hypothetical protein